MVRLRFVVDDEESAKSASINRTQNEGEAGDTAGVEGFRELIVVVVAGLKVVF